VGLVGQWFAHVKFLGSLSTPWITIRSFLATFSTDFKTSLALGILGFSYYVEWWEFVRMDPKPKTLWVETHERKIRAIWPHRLLGLNFYLIRVVTIWTCEGALIIIFDGIIDYSSYMDCVHGYGCLMWRDFLVPLFFHYSREHMLCFDILWDLFKGLRVMELSFLIMSHVWWVEGVMPLNCNRSKAEY
jgi:hypothetical protein